MAREIGNLSTPTPKLGKTMAGRLKSSVRFILPIIVLGGGIVGVMTMGALKDKPETKKEAPKAAPVLIAQAQTRTLALNIQTQGEVKPRREINVAAQIGGKISYVSPAFLEGGQFKKGDVLLRIESTDYDLSVTQAQANVAQANTVLTRELSEADIARQDWDDLGQGTASPLSLREPQVAEARANLAASTAMLDKAKLQRSRTVVTAPFDGRIREKNVSIGEIIAAGQKLGRMYGVDIADVKIALTDSDLAKLGLGIGFNSSAKTPGPVVTYSANVAGEMHSWQGRLTRTDSSYDPETRILYAYTELKNPYAKGSDNGTPMASGLFVSAVIAGRTTENSIVVPRNALRGTDKVFIANNDNTLSIRTVKVASSSRHQVVITSGLRSGENVIISPVRGAAEGMPIEIATTLVKKTDEAAIQTDTQDETEG